jgi:hypothetical protein
MMLREYVRHLVTRLRVRKRVSLLLAALNAFQPPTHDFSRFVESKTIVYVEKSEQRCRIEQFKRCSHVEVKLSYLGKP